MNGAPPPVDPRKENPNLKQEHKKGSLKQKNIETLIKHKGKVQNLVGELEVLEESLNNPKKRVTFDRESVTDPPPSPKAESEPQPSYIALHKANVQRSLEQIKSTEKALAAVKSGKPEPVKSESVIPVNPPTEMGKKLSERDVKESVKSLESRGKGKEEDAGEDIEQIYREAGVDYTQLAKETLLAEKEAAERWVEKSIDLVSWICAVLILISSIMTAFSGYIFVYLPKAVYSQHILKETFLMQDGVINLNKFPKKPGLQMMSCLPYVVSVMYLTVLYIVYMLQYPKQNRFLQFLRYIIFTIIEAFLILCIVSYCIDVSGASDRLEEFFEKDKGGLVFEPGAKAEAKLHLLYHSQEYFGCCGFHSRKEWAEYLPDNYTDKYPLSCCDAKTSGIACYAPVRETVTYIEAPEQWRVKKEPEVPVTKNRLWTGTCYYWENLVVRLAISLIIVFTFIYIMLSTWSLFLISKIALKVTKFNMELKNKSQYVDFF